MKFYLVELLNDAFIAGFMASAEGFNGEYPFDCDESRIRPELFPAFDVWLREHAEIEADE